MLIPEYTSQVGTNLVKEVYNESTQVHFVYSGSTLKHGATILDVTGYSEITSLTGYTAPFHCYGPTYLDSADAADFYTSGSGSGPLRVGQTSRTTSNIGIYFPIDLIEGETYTISVTQGTSNGMDSTGLACGVYAGETGAAPISSAFGYINAYVSGITTQFVVTVPSGAQGIVLYSYNLNGSAGDYWEVSSIRIQAGNHNYFNGMELLNITGIQLSDGVFDYSEGPLVISNTDVAGGIRSTKSTANFNWGGIRVEQPIIALAMEAGLAISSGTATINLGASSITNPGTLQFELRYNLVGNYTFSDGVPTTVTYFSTVGTPRPFDSLSVLWRSDTAGDYITIEDVYLEFNEPF